MDRYELILMRLQAGLKQYQLAQLLGVPQTTMCDWERGRRPINLEVERRIRQALNQKLSTASKTSEVRRSGQKTKQAKSKTASSKPASCGCS